MHPQEKCHEIGLAAKLRHVTHMTFLQKFLYNSNFCGHEYKGIKNMVKYDIFIKRAFYFHNYYYFLSFLM